MGNRQQLSTTADRATPTWPPQWLPWLAVALIAAVWPLVGFGAREAWLSNRNRIEDWLPPSFPETRSLMAFAEKFGSDEFLMISWEGCTLEDDRASKLAGLLLSPAADGKVYFHSANGGQQMLDSLLASSERLTRQSALARLRGLFVGDDAMQTCVIALVSQAGLDSRAKAVDWARQCAEEASGLSPADVHIAGSTIDSVAIDEASQEHLFELTLLSTFVCLAILAVSVRSFWLVATIFATAVFSQHFALAFIYFSGGHVDSIQLLVANLAFVLTISAGLHYLGYFRDQHRKDHCNAAIKAFKAAWKPSFVAAATTSLGFLSLCASEIVPIRRFGFYAAIVVPITAATIVAVLTIHSSWASNRNWRFARTETLVPELRGQPQWPALLVNGLLKSPGRVIAVWLLVILSCGAGLRWLESSVGTNELLPPQSKLRQDYRWLESKVGGLVPIELVLRFPADSDLSLIDRVRILRQLQSRLIDLPSVGSAMSVLNFMPDLPKEGGIRNTVLKSVTESYLKESLDRFQSMRLIYSDAAEQSWRLSGRVSGAAPPSYETLLANIDQIVSQVVIEHATKRIGIDISGGVPFVNKTQQQLLIDLINSFLCAFAMIALAMMMIFRSWKVGFVSMLPNIAPPAIVFGLMGWFGWKLELGSMMTASVVLGVCMDDTLHLISHFLISRRKGCSPREAVIHALENSGAALIQTATVCGLGMLVFSVSPFTPIARFAWLTFLLLFIGLLCDLVLTPAILLTPIHHALLGSQKDRKISRE